MGEATAPVCWLPMYWPIVTPTRQHPHPSQPFRTTQTQCGHGGVGPRRAHDRVSPGLPFLSTSSSSPSPGTWLQLSALEGAPEEPSSGRQTPSIPREMDK